jgi:hypothetical protein
VAVCGCRKVETDGMWMCLQDSTGDSAVRSDSAVQSDILTCRMAVNKTMTSSPSSCKGDTMCTYVCDGREGEASSQGTMTGQVDCENSPLETGPR